MLIDPHWVHELGVGLGQALASPVLWDSNGANFGPISGE